MDAVLEYELAEAQEEIIRKPAPKPPESVAEYLAMPEGAPYYQFINGEVIIMAAPTLAHQKAIRRLLQYLGNFVDTYSLGELYGSPVDVYFSEKNYFEPDLVFVSNDRAHILTEKNIQGAPDLVVEVLSPSTGYYDLSHKKAIYEQEGVREYWLVYPNELRVEVLQNTDNGFIVLNQARKTGVVRSAVLEGFTLEIAEIFE
jgi:Uma2 family endonuclease